MGYIRKIWKLHRTNNINFLYLAKYQFKDASYKAIDLKNIEITDIVILAKGRTYTVPPEDIILDCTKNQLGIWLPANKIFRHKVGNLTISFKYRMRGEEHFSTYREKFRYAPISTLNEKLKRDIRKH